MRVRRAASSGWWAAAPALWTLACLGPVLIVAFFIELTGSFTLRPLSGAEFDNTWPNIVFGTLMPPLGALVLSRRPRHAVGWVLLVCGLASAVTLAVYPYAHRGLVRDYPGAVAAAWVSEWAWGLGVIPMVTLGVLLFPDGRLPSRRWRLLLTADLLAVALVFFRNAFHPGRLENHPAATNPLALPLSATVTDVAGGIGMALFLAGFLGGAVAAVVRWRRADGPDRAQLGWFAFAAATLVVAVLAPLPSDLHRLVSLFAVPLLPLTVAVAILRGRLAGIEVAVRRSLLYAALTAVLVLAYALLVTGLGLLLGGRGSGAPALVATALVAVGFAPVRDRAQRAVDRLLYGDRRDPYAVLSSLGRRLDDAPSTGGDELGETLREIAATVAGSLRLPYVRVEVGRPGQDVAVAEAGQGPTGGMATVTLAYRDEPVGCLTAASPTPQDPFRPPDLRLLEDLGRQIGVAAHAMLLGRDLQRSREQLVALREEERRRMRRDLHDGLGPALAGVALGLDAVGRMAAPGDPDIAELADRLKSEVQQSLADVRRLVEDLRPPDLDQWGLLGALEHHARRVNERHPYLDVRVSGADLPPLPAAVEVAAYRIATEALTNVGRHAAARSCVISLTMDDAHRLCVEVEDDGVGLQAPSRPGVGLNAMRERATELGGTCAVASPPRGGTRVRALLPVGVPA